MKNNRLEKSNLKKQYTDFRFYYAYEGEKIEIDIEPCMGGFCVAAYDLNKDQIEPKKCVDADGYDLDIWGIKPRSNFVWKRALEIANEILERHS